MNDAKIISELELARNIIREYGAKSINSETFLISSLVAAYLAKNRIRKNCPHLAVIIDEEIITITFRLGMI